MTDNRFGSWQATAPSLHRRRFLALAAPFVAAPMLTTKAALAAVTPVKALSFYNIHTGERLKAVYKENGRLIGEALGDINKILRDWRTDEVARMDPTLLDLLFDLQRRLDCKEAFHIISGYRSPKSNALLAAKSKGVATKSLHMQGKAIDIFLPGRDLKVLRDTAKAMERGGVGYYPKSEFVHLDTGRVRSW